MYYQRSPPLPGFSATARCRRRFVDIALMPLPMNYQKRCGARSMPFCRKRFVSKGGKSLKWKGEDILWVILRYSGAFAINPVLAFTANKQTLWSIYNYIYVTPYIYRFTPEEKAKRPLCAYLPFGHGPRNCIGMRFALLEVKMALISILQKYTIALAPETEVRDWQMMGCCDTQVLACYKGRWGLSCLCLRSC